jgi:hypothetical protein
MPFVLNTKGIFRIMKLTVKQLRQIIKEEISNLQNQVNSKPKTKKMRLKENENVSKKLTLTHVKNTDDINELI